ncbi:MAG: shikimate dehydrogenase, partial [Gammaproteobacteria bacterium]|nr:shikimate dehydrogenase [Gammaproteobacteria bacterium]
AALYNADGIINATPVGMNDNPGLPFSDTLLKPHHWVAEIIYFPIETELLRSARAKGCKTMNGGGMAVNQAAAAFEIFTGIKPDTKRMHQHFSDLILQKNNGK